VRGSLSKRFSVRFLRLLHSHGVEEGVDTPRKKCRHYTTNRRRDRGKGNDVHDRAGKERSGRRVQWPADRSRVWPTPGFVPPRTLAGGRGGGENLIKASERKKSSGVKRGRRCRLRLRGATYRGIKPPIIGKTASERRRGRLPLKHHNNPTFPPPATTSGGILVQIYGI